MSNDLQRFFRAVRTLLELSVAYDDAAFLDASAQHATTKQEKRVILAGVFLDTIGQALMRQRFGCCRQCGKDIHVTLRGTEYDIRAGRNRTDTQYCSPACRQKAYRSRVTAKTANASAKRNGVTARTAKPKLRRNGNAQRSQDVVTP